MKIGGTPFGTTDWSTVPATHHPGETGSASWRTRQFGAIRVRMVEYSPGYLDHWSEKGHILLCLEGELQTELADGRTFVLKPGMSYQVADVAEHAFGMTARSRIAHAPARPGPSCSLWTEGKRRWPIRFRISAGSSRRGSAQR